MNWHVFLMVLGFGGVALVTLACAIWLAIKVGDRFGFGWGSLCYWATALVGAATFAGLIVGLSA